MWKYGFLTLFLLFCLCLSATEKKDFEKAVREAVSWQMQTYPKSTLKDLYKNFFQDKFGPGHIISDTTAAGNYLRRELASYTECTGEIAEPTGWEGNFLRVNLSVIKNGRVPYNIFFDAFVRSVNGVRLRCRLQRNRRPSGPGRICGASQQGFRRILFAALSYNQQANI